MKKLMLTISSVLAFTGCVAFAEEAAKSSTPAGFSDNLDAAFASAAKSGKCVFACFSGSDWCGWCIKLEQEVFSQKEFLDAATNDFELVFVDMPRNKDVLSERAKTENPKLVKKYGIRGFPTAILFNSKGEKIGQTGYRQGGAKAYAEHLRELKGAEAVQLLANKWIQPYADRQRKIMEDLNTVCGEYQKAEMAKGVDMKVAREASIKFVPAAAEKLEALLKELEALKVPAEIEPMHQEQISAHKGLLQMLRGATDDTETKKTDNQ